MPNLLTSSTLVDFKYGKVQYLPSFRGEMKWRGEERGELDRKVFNYSCML